MDMEQDVSPDFEKQDLTSREAAQRLGVAHVTVSQLCQHGKLRAQKIAGRWLISRDDLEKFGKTYRGKRGRPSWKRVYTKRSTYWSRLEK